MGLSFSVPEGVKVPPSLRNMYKELEKEGYSGYAGYKSGDPEISALLEKYAQHNVVYPPMPSVFQAFETLRPEEVKVATVAPVITHHLI